MLREVFDEIQSKHFRSGVVERQELVALLRVRQDPLHSSNPKQKDRFKSQQKVGTQAYY